MGTEAAPHDTSAARAAEVSAVGLGNTADFAPVIAQALPPPGTVKAYALRFYAREVLARHGVQKRLRFCGARIRPRDQGVSVYARPDRAYGRVAGVCVCGQSLCCPVCAPRVAAFRANEVAEAFKRAQARGYEARLVTFTMPHRRADHLGREIDAFSAAWRRFGKGWSADQSRRFSLGNHVGRECTWSAEHGWHYHHHQLRYDEPGKFDAERMHAQWLTALDYVGRKWRGAEKHAFDVGVVGQEAGARYVSKLATSVEAQARAIGSEVSSSITKGRNLNTLLAHAMQGDDYLEGVWFMGVREIIRRKVSSVRWSRGLRDELGLGIEKDDTQVAEEEKLPTDVLLGALNAHQWRGILRWKAEFPLLCAANKGREAVNEFLSGLDLGELDEPAPVAVETPIKGDYAYARL